MLLQGAATDVSSPRTTREWLNKLGNRTLQCSGCEFVARYLQREIGAQLIDDLRGCRGDPQCLKELLSRKMRARCNEIGSVDEVGPLVLIDGKRYAHHSETLRGDSPKHVEFVTEFNAVFANFCSGLIGNGGWLAQAMADTTFRKIPLVAFNMSRQACDRELGVCEYDDEEGLDEAVNEAITRSSADRLEAAKGAAEKQEDDAKAEWKRFKQAAAKFKADRDAGKIAEMSAAERDAAVSPGLSKEDL